MDLDGSHSPTSTCRFRWSNLLDRIEVVELRYGGYRHSVEAIEEPTLEIWGRFFRRFPRERFQKASFLSGFVLSD